MLPILETERLILRPLTEEEAKEQQALRMEYVANIRANLKSQLDNIDIKEADGTIVNLGELHKNK
mgnify:CR=1 FL=1